MGFLRIFWKNNVQEVYLPKMSISGQIDPPKKLEGFVWSFVSIIGLRLEPANISETICHEMLIFGK